LKCGGFTTLCQTEQDLNPDMDLKPEMDSSFLCRCCSGSWSYVIGFFDFSLLNIFGTQSSEQLQKKIQPPACLGHRLHVLAFFSLRGIVLQKCGRDINCSLDYGSSWVKNSDISPTKIEQHFGGLWNFETPLMLLSLSQKKSSPFYEMKNLFFLQIYS
jgi:hypothetical protein